MIVGVAHASITSLARHEFPHAAIDSRRDANFLYGYGTILISSLFLVLSNGIFTYYQSRAYGRRSRRRRYCSAWLLIFRGALMICRALAASASLFSSACCWPHCSATRASSQSHCRTADAPPWVRNSPPRLFATSRASAIESPRREARRLDFSERADMPAALPGVKSCRALATQLLYYLPRPNRPE